MSRLNIDTVSTTDTLSSGFNKVNDNFTEVYASIIQAGFIIDYVGSSAPTGWLVCNGSTIGSAASSATGRANADTETLFNLLWNNWANDQAAVSGGRGASSTVDFAANKTIAIPDLRGNVSAGIGSGAFSLIGNTFGEVVHTLIIDEIPAPGDHIHNNPSVLDISQYQMAAAGGDLSVQLNSGSTTSAFTDNANGYPSAGGGAHNNIQPTIVLNKIIKL